MQKTRLLSLGGFRPNLTFTGSREFGHYERHLVAVIFAARSMICGASLNSLPH